MGGFLGLVSSIAYLVSGEFQASERLCLKKGVVVDNIPVGFLVSTSRSHT